MSLGFPGFLWFLCAKPTESLEKVQKLILKVMYPELHSYSDRLTCTNISTLREYLELQCEQNFQKVLDTGHHLHSLLPVKTSSGTYHAFVISRIDFCNSLLYGLPNSQLSRLQKLQNQAAQRATGSALFDHITPVLASLHWLSVKRCIEIRV